MTFTVTYETSAVQASGSGKNSKQQRRSDQQFGDPSLSTVSWVTLRKNRATFKDLKSEIKNRMEIEN